MLQKITVFICFTTITSTLGARIAIEYIPIYPQQTEVSPKLSEFKVQFQQSDNSPRERYSVILFRNNKNVDNDKLGDFIFPTHPAYIDRLTTSSDKNSNNKIPNVTIRPWKYRNCVLCCDPKTTTVAPPIPISVILTRNNTVSDPASFPVIDSANLPVCQRCCTYQPQDEEDYDAIDDDDDKIGAHAIATILG